MMSLYEFLVGPGAWIAFIVFFAGLAIRLVFLIGLSRGMDPVFWNHMDWGWGLKSIFHWLVPWGSDSLKSQPLFSLVLFLFHVGWIFIPIFLGAHNLLFEESFGWRLPYLSQPLADWLSMGVIACGVFLLVRRLARPEVRILTSAWDYFLLLLALSPFVTGVVAFNHWGDYQTWLVLHIMLSELLLIIIPFSKLAHVVLFFFTRAFIGFEMGGRRGARAW